MIAPKLQKTPRWAPAIDGRPDVTLGVFYRSSEAVRVARDQLAPDEHHKAGAVRVWVAFE